MNWGPADWSVVITAGVVILGAVGSLAGWLADLGWRGIYPRRNPPCDARDKLPYRRP